MAMMVLRIRVHVILGGSQLLSQWSIICWVFCSQRKGRCCWQMMDGWLLQLLRELYSPIFIGYDAHPCWESSSFPAENDRKGSTASTAPLIHSFWYVFFDGGRMLASYLSKTLGFQKNMLDEWEMVDECWILSFRVFQNTVAGPVLLNEPLATSTAECHDWTVHGVNVLGCPNHPNPRLTKLMVHIWKNPIWYGYGGPK